MSSKPNSWYITLGLFGAAGFQLAVSVVLGLLGGAWVDKKIGSGPWLMLLGLMLGLASGLYQLIRILNSKNDRLSK